MDSPQAGLVHGHDLPGSAKAEITAAALNEDFAKKDTSWRPYANTVATATVYVAFHVALDTVRCATISKRKEASVDQEWLSRCYRNIEGVAIF